jgi:hypothetical protein
MVLPLLLNQLRGETRPTRLMTCSNPRAVIAMKIFMEWKRREFCMDPSSQELIQPLRDNLRRFKHGPVAVLW